MESQVLHIWWTQMDNDSSDMKKSVDQAGFAFCTVISRYIIDYIHTIVSLPKFRFIQIFLEQKIASRIKRNFFLTDHKRKPLSQGEILYVSIKSYEQFFHKNLYSCLVPFFLKQLHH